MNICGDAVYETERIYILEPAKQGNDGRMLVHNVLFLTELTPLISTF